MLEAYFDASKRDGGILCVAGFAYGIDRAKTAMRALRTTWGEKQFHMTDLHSRPERHYGFTKAEAHDIFERTVQIPIANASFGIAVSCRLDEIQRLAPTQADPGSRDILSGFRTGYALCCHAAMAALGDLAGPGTSIAYFLEHGDEHQGEAREFIRLMTSHPIAAKFIYKMSSHKVLTKADCRLFELSDMLAWEWAKHVERTAASMPIRPSLQAILGDDLAKKGELNVKSANRRGWHLTGAPLDRYYSRAWEYELFSDSPSPAALERLQATFEKFQARSPNADTPRSS